MRSPLFQTQSTETINGQRVRDIPIIRGPITNELLEEGYQSATYGRWEPRVLRGSAATIGRVRYTLSTIPWRPDVYTTNKFNEAVLTVDDTLPDNFVVFDQAHYPAICLLD